MVSGRTKTLTTTLFPLRHREAPLVVWVSDLREDLKNLALSLRQGGAGSGVESSTGKG